MKVCPVCASAYADTIVHCPRDGTVLAASGEWAEGTVIRGKYRILAKVGQGGMGTVYKAQHLRFQELRALKVMSAELATDATFLKRFEQEAVLTRKLQHPNAVRVDDIDESEDGRPYIVMEFIEGRSLSSLIAQEGPQPVLRTCAIIKQAAAALDAAHKLGMVHRDIKPENIALLARVGAGASADAGPFVKVLDFGIAKLKEARAGNLSPVSKLTGTGVLLGTPDYMSPEQALGKVGDELDGRSDLYSLGVVMYEMLTGKLPFKADGSMEMILARLQGTPIPIQAARPDLNIPAGIAAVVMSCLAKKPEGRPVSAENLIERITAAEKYVGGVRGGTIAIGPSREKYAGPPGAAHPAPMARPAGVSPASASPGVGVTPPAAAAQPAWAGPPLAPKPAPPVVGEEAPSSHLPRIIGLTIIAILLCVWWYKRSHPVTVPENLPPSTPQAVQSPLKPEAADQLYNTDQSPQTHARLGADHFNRGNQFLSHNDWDGALAEYREAVQENPDDANAHNQLGVVLGHKGDAEGEIAEYREAIRAKPDYAEAHLNLGGALGQKGDWDDDIVEQREAIRLNPGLTFAHTELGVALAWKKDFDAAIAEFRIAIQQKPEFAMAHNFLGATLESKGQLQEAMGEYRKAFELDPNNQRIRDNYERLVKRFNQ